MISTLDIDIYSISTFEKCGKCPSCGNEMLRPKKLSRRTGKKIGGACPMCGYKESKQEQKTREQQEEGFTLEARKNKAIGYMNKYSILSTGSVFNNSFSNFETKTKDEKSAFDKAKLVAKKMAREPTHCLMVGATGRGKTHLATAMMYEIQRQTDYGKKVLFLSFPALINDTKKGMNLPDVRKQVDESMNQLKHADLLIIDDLGAERESEFTLAIIDDIIQYGEDSSMILTTNLTGEELSQKYGDRFLSRLKKAGAGNSISFSRIADHRG